MDGRYFFQAGQELSAEWKLMRIGEDPAVDIWMADNLPKEASIGVDPWCISIDTAQRWECAFCQKASEAGRSVADKLKDVRKKPVQEQAQDSIFSFFRMVYSYLKEVHNKFFQNGLFVPLLEVFQKCLGIIFTAIDEVSWLYNIRGSDVAYCSIVHAFSIVTSNSAFIYVDMRKVSVENSVELDGLKKAHIQDGAAVVQYLVWLDKKMQDIYGASGYFLEKDSVKKEKHF
ncbi:hypothetical protein GLYMA_11G064600v4 [Glycine max]|nr:hypothetical protein GLYMA_11G064600v4 [Glycine max]KAG4386523.1 hypothetical protein GLYMA_11G064600v4 [Glycine max]